MTEKSVSEHFESVEIRYARGDQQKIRFDINLYGINPSLSAEISVFYGVPDDVESIDDLGDSYQFKASLSTDRDEDSLYAEFFVDRDFSRLLVEVHTGYMKEGVATCGYTHYLIVGPDDLPADSKNGRLGPMLLNR